jgi:hypothetical protein
MTAYAKNAGVSLDQKKEETALEKFDRFREEGSKYNKVFEPDKDEEERFYVGEHWKDKDPTNRPKNHIFQIVESEIPLLMDPMPSTDVAAHDQENYGDHAMILGAAKDHVYFQQQIFLKDAQTFRQMLITGSGYQYVDFDPDGEKGEGSITLKILDRKQVTKDPAADTLDECRYIIIDSALSNDDLKRRYPKTWKEAVNQPLKDNFVFASTKGQRERQNIITNSGQQVNRFESKDMTFIEEGWFKDYTMEAIPDDETQIQLTEESAQLMNGINPDISKWEDHAAHMSGHADQKVIIVAEALQIAPEMVTEQDIENAKQDPEIALRLNIIDDHIEMHQLYVDSMDEDEIGKRPKYPNNLRLIIKTGKVVHFDGAPPVDDGIVPLVEFECYKYKGPAEGIVKNLIPLQKTVNELDAKELRGLKKHASSLWIVDSGAEIDDDTLTDEDDLIVTKNSGYEATRVAPGQVSTQLQARALRDYEAMQRIEGAGETVFGEAPKHEASGVMYRRMQMQALGRIRLKSRMIEAAVYRRDLLILSRIMKYWSTERKLRTEDANGRVRFIKFDPRMMRDFTYELVISPGTTAGMDSETISETYKEMLNNQQIDLPTYLKLTNLPKKQDLLAILEEQNQQVAQIQQMEAQNQELQKQMLMMKANLAPETLTPEEVKMVEQLALQEQQAQLTTNPLMAVGNDQATGVPA